MEMREGMLQFARALLTVMKWIGAVVAVVILIVAGLFAYGRLRGPDAERRAALAAMQPARAPPVVAGQTVVQRYAALPADLHSPGHASGVSADGRSLYVVDRWHPGRPDARFVLPLPIATATAAAH